MELRLVGLASHLARVPFHLLLFTTAKSVISFAQSVRPSSSAEKGLYIFLQRCIYVQKKDKEGKKGKAEDA